MIIGLLAAKGAPGVTTSALALTWALGRRGERSAAMVECDRSGGDLVCWFTEPAEPGLLSLASAHAPQYDSHLTTLSAHGIRALVAPANAISVTAALDALGATAARRIAALADTAVVDFGRVASPDDLARAAAIADCLIIVCQPTLSGVEHTSTLIDRVRPLVDHASLVVIGDSPYRPGEVSDALSIPLSGAWPHDPRAVRSLLGLASARAWPRSLLAHAATATASSLVERTRASHDFPTSTATHHD